jgi:hypothetical protein
LKLSSFSLVVVAVLAAFSVVRDLFLFGCVFFEVVARCRSATPP